MKVLLLEHKKRKKAPPAEHPDFHIVKSTSHGGMGVNYKAHDKKTGEFAGELSGSYNKASRKFYVNYVHAKNMEIQSPEAEAARKAGQHHLPRSLTTHIVKDIKKSFPGALRMTASRVSGANPNHKIDVPLRHEKPKEGRTGYRVLNRKSATAKIKMADGHTVNVGAGYMSGNRELQGTRNWRDIRASVRAIQANDPHAKTVKATSNYRLSNRSIVVRKPKKSVVYAEPQNKSYHVADAFDTDVQHSKRGHLGVVRVDVISQVGKVSFDRGSHTNQKTVGHPKLTFGQKRKIYRIVKARAAKAGIQTLRRDRTGDTNGFLRFGNRTKIIHVNPTRGAKLSSKINPDVRRERIDALRGRGRRLSAAASLLSREMSSNPKIVTRASDRARMKVNRLKDMGSKASLIADKFDRAKLTPDRRENADGLVKHFRHLLRRKTLSK